MRKTTEETPTPLSSHDIITSDRGSAASARWQAAARAGGLSLCVGPMRQFPDGPVAGDHSRCRLTFTRALNS